MPVDVQSFDSYDECWTYWPKYLKKVQAHIYVIGYCVKDENSYDL